MSEKKTLIEVKNVNKVFTKGGASSHVLHDVSFKILDGSFTIIYGPSGSGKSTMLNALIGLDPPSSGHVVFDGKNLYGMTTQERAFFRANTMGMVQQTNYWVKSLTVIENVALPLYFLGYSYDKAKDQAYKSLERIGMEVHAKKYPTVLSGGEQQRVAMARALVNDPTYIVADEPTGNLDSKNGDMVMNLLKHFNKNLNRTIVLVTHNLEYVPLGDKLLFIQDGIVTETKETDVHKVTNRLLGEMKKRIDNWAGAGHASK
jgi:putative ABC transport system ATP-binding protein